MRVHVKKAHIYVLTVLERKDISLVQLEKTEEYNIQDWA